LSRRLVRRLSRRFVVSHVIKRFAVASPRLVGKKFSARACGPIQCVRPDGIRSRRVRSYKTSHPGKTINGARQVSGCSSRTIFRRGRPTDQPTHHSRFTVLKIVSQRSPASVVPSRNGDQRRDRHVLGRNSRSVLATRGR